MKNLLSTLFLAGSLVLGGCGDKSKMNMKSRLYYRKLEPYIVVKDSISQSKENKEKYEILIDSIPK